MIDKKVADLGPILAPVDLQAVSARREFMAPYSTVTPVAEKKTFLKIIIFKHFSADFIQGRKGHNIPLKDSAKYDDPNIFYRAPAWIMKSRLFVTTVSSFLSLINLDKTAGGGSRINKNTVASLQSVRQQVWQWPAFLPYYQRSADCSWFWAVL